MLPARQGSERAAYLRGASLDIWSLDKLTLTSLNRPQKFDN